MRGSGTRRVLSGWVLLCLAAVLPSGAVRVWGSQERLFTIQVASLESGEEADAIVRQLLARGLAAYRQPAVIPGVGLRQRVRFGRFATANLAKAAAEQARQAGWIAEFIIVREEPGSVPTPTRVGGAPPERREVPTPVPPRNEPLAIEPTPERVTPPRVEIADPAWERMPASTLPNEGWQAVWFVDPLTGWIGGRRGALRRTTDGGQTWKRLPLGQPLAVRTLFFLDWRHGWLIGEAPDAGTVLLATEDGGEQWVERTSAEGQPWRAFCFLDTQLGLGIRGEGTLWRSTDGGRQWTEVKGPPGTWPSPRIEELQCLPRSASGKASPRAWGISGPGPEGESQLWETSDGAAGSWQRVPLPQPTEPGPTRLRHLRVSPQGLVHLEIGSGSAPQWETLLTVSAATPDARVLSPDEARRRWQRVGSAPTGTLLASAFPEISTGWRLVSGPGEWPRRLLTTTDQGALWQESLRLGGTGRLLLWFASPRHGWLISEEGWVLTYRASPLPPPTALRASPPAPASTRPE